ncbi:MAG: lytic transglycosylase domain-containing protein [Desulfacinum sp.]|nr:lytic transglycosylase domain-containing protein [Desulfacinum sp.]
MAFRLRCLRKGTGEKAASRLKMAATILTVILIVGLGSNCARAGAQERPILLVEPRSMGPAPKESAPLRMAAIPLHKNLPFGKAVPFPEETLLGRRGFHVPDHPLVERYVGYFTGKWKKGFQESLDRAWPYLPLMAEILDVMGVPTELAYVVLVESHFKGKARSSAGAAGFWQLMPATARSLGLRVDAYVDERLDPLRSTQAAAVYLRKLYDRFGSWDLALAAYNAGAGTVRRAIRRHGTHDFWELRERRALPKQTRFYVPKILAAVHICRDLDRYGFDRPRFLPVWAFTTVWVQQPLSLGQVAQWSGIPLKDLRRLNPALRKGKIPSDGYRLRLPPAVVEKFLSAYETYLAGRG